MFTLSKILAEIMDMEKGGQLNENEDTVREKTIAEVLEIIKKYIK